MGLVKWLFSFVMLKVQLQIVEVISFLCHFQR